MRLDHKPLRDQIADAHEKLCCARLDGACDRIVYWVKRRDELLEQLTAANKTASELLK